MSIFRWIESKLWTGEVIKDYGCISEQKFVIARLRTSLLLCRRKGKLQLVFRHSFLAPLAASVSYSYVSVEAAPRLREALEDIERTAREYAIA